MQLEYSPEQEQLRAEIRATAERMPDHVGHISRYCPMAA